MDDADAEALPRVAQGVLDDLRALVLAQIPDARLQPHGHMDRMARREIGAPQVRDPGAEQARMWTRPRPPRTFSPASAARELERRLPSRSLHRETE
jgi:hypothetical protein